MAPPRVELIEHPNQVSPAGKHYDRAAICAAGERGKQLMASERYLIRSMIVDGERAAVQIEWTGLLSSGLELRAQICSIIELRDGKVWRQEQYDCFVS